MLALVIALASFVLAAAVVFLLVPSDGEHRASRTPEPSPTGGTPGPGSATPSETPSQTPSETPSPPRTIGSLPAPCGTVASGTVRQIIPGAQQRQSANNTLTTCTYTSTGSAFRWLRVEAHLYAPSGAADPVKDAGSYYDAQWSQAHDPPLERTITLERQPGIGDEAFRWFKADKGQPTVVGQVTTRVRNAVVTITYSEQAPGKGEQDERERSCLAKAAQVAREVLRALR